MNEKQGPGRTELLDPNIAIESKSNSSDNAAVSELALCHGPMPEINVKKNIYQVASGQNCAAKSGVVDTVSSDAIPEQDFFSNTIVPSKGLAGDTASVKFKHIILATDLSPNADAAVPFAVALAKQSGGTIHILHAFEDQAGEPLASGVLIGAPAWLESVHEKRREKLIKIATNLGSESGVPVTHTCVHGHPAAEVVKFAREVHADLIVISTHGRTGIQHLFLGSIAEKVVRLSPIPVLTVRPGEAVPGQSGFKTILVPTDFSENAEAAIPYAVELARQHGAKLILAHVIENTTYYSDPTWSVGVGPDIELWNETIKAQGEKKLAEAAAMLASKSNLAVTTVLKCGRAHGEICDIAREYKADLVIMSTHGYTGFSHLAYGSVTERVLRTCQVPMLSIRPSVNASPSKELL